MDARNGVFEKWLEQCQKERFDRFSSSRPEFWRALSVLDRCIATGYGGARPFSERAVLHFAIEEHPRTLADASEAVRLEPGNAEHWARLGGAHIASNQHTGAVLAFQEAARLEPGNADRWVGLGRAHSRAGQHPEAVLAFREAVRVQPARVGEPGTSSYWHWEMELAAGLSTAGSYVEAEKTCSDILAAAPGCTDTMMDRAKTRHCSGDYAGAVADYRACADADPRSPWGSVWQAWVTITCPDAAVRNVPEGLALANRINERLGTRPARGDAFAKRTILLVLAAGHAQSGRFDEARRAIEERRRYLPDPKVLEEWQKKVAERRAARDAGDWEQARSVSEWLVDNPLPMELQSSWAGGYWATHLRGIEEAILTGRPYYEYPVAPHPRPRP